ncbi:hypothetical protein F5X99DRAFT_399529 [Biscogniauxia marginata]|nr:hypothetical protein F5X99DRAFT_399529 [Biscogniauxia marginata]
MRRWMPLSLSISARSRQPRARFLSTATREVERVKIRSGSSGSINIDLYNIANLPSSDALLLYLPPYSVTSPRDAFHPPSFCLRYPTAVINYRWSGFSPFRVPNTSSFGSPGKDGKHRKKYLGWPTPIHDVLNAYTWILENFRPPDHARKAIYVYGSYLGASLASSLALTESYLHRPMTIRGCIAYNGIYEWTRCCPDHPIHKIKRRIKTEHGYRSVVKFRPMTPSWDADFHTIEQNIEQLFGDPQHLFDPFASPCLFFYTPGLLAPPSFNVSATSIPSLRKTYPDLKDETLISIGAMLNNSKSSKLVYPPPDELRGTPEMLLLYTKTPNTQKLRVKRHRRPSPGRNFKDQAERFSAAIRDQIKFEDSGGPEDWEDWEEPEKQREEKEREEEAMRLREQLSQVHRVGINPEMGELSGEGDELAATWLEESIDKLTWS